MQLAIVILAFLIFSACSTTSKNPIAPHQGPFPNLVEWEQGKDPQVVQSYLDLYKTQHPSLQAQWWALYHEARIWAHKDPARSCRVFQQLGSNSKFPLADLAQLRSRGLCLNNKAPFQLDAYDQISQSKPWLRDLALSIAMQSAQMTKDPKALMQLWQEKAREETREKDKEDDLNQAITIAVAQKDKKALTQIREKLYEIAPRLNPAPSPSEWLKVAHDWKRVRDFKKARRIYVRVVRSTHFSDEDRFRALLGIRSSFKLEQNTAGYIRSSLNIARYAAQSWRSHPKNQHLLKRYYESAVQSARTVWTEGDSKKATQILIRLAKELGGRVPMDETDWLRGRLLEEQHDYKGALSWYKKGLEDGPQNDSIHEKIQWCLAWDERKTGDLTDAITLLQTLKKSSQPGFDQNKYSYWLARSYKEKGDSKESAQAFKDLVAQDPLGYYGVLAHHELQLSFPPEEVEPIAIANLRSPNLASLSKSKVFPKKKDHQYIEWLLATGEDDIASRYLHIASNRLRQNPKTDDQTWLELFQYDARAGRYADLFRVTNNLSNNLRQKILQNHYELLFPRPFFPLVSASASKFGVSPELIYSIMRQESSFDPRTRSPADAFGLMQLIPEAAQKMASDTDITFHDPEQLYDPEINIPLGAALLRHLMTLYHGQFLFTVAAYNASEKAVQSWMTSRYQNDPVEFIEDIPYEETKTYVKLVLRNFVFYSRLTAPQESTSFPQWCLESLHASKE